MGTHCEQAVLEFQGLNNRRVEAAFDGGKITSDGGGLLLREVEARCGILRQFAACFRDHRQSEYVEHTVEELVGQRVYALALGYEDLNDHDDLRRDPLLATLAGKADPTGGTRRSPRDPRQGAGGQEHAQPLGVDSQRRGRVEPVQKDRLGRRGGRSAFDRCVFAGARPWRRREFFWISPPRTIRSTAIRRGGSSTATTTSTAICRCIFSAAIIR